MRSQQWFNNWDITIFYIYLYKYLSTLSIPDSSKFFSDNGLSLSSDSSQSVLLNQRKWLDHTLTARLRPGWEITWWYHLKVKWTYSINCSLIPALLNIYAWNICNGRKTTKNWQTINHQLCCLLDDISLFSNCVIFPSVVIMDQSVF
jgi:hypothetical protein